MVRKVLKVLAVFVISIVLLMIVFLESFYHYNIHQLKPEKVLPLGQYSEELLDLQWVAFDEVGDRNLESYSATRFIVEIIKMTLMVSYGSKRGTKLTSISGIYVSNTLVKVLDYKRVASPMKNLGHHLRSLMLGIWVSKNYTTDEALSVLLDHYYFGRDSYGIASVAKQFFSKEVGDLSLNEALVLMTMQKGTFRFNPMLNPDKNRTRAEELLEKLQKNWPEKYSSQVFVVPKLTVSYE